MSQKAVVINYHLNFCSDPEGSLRTYKQTTKTVDDDITPPPGVDSSEYTRISIINHLDKDEIDLANANVSWYDTSVVTVFTNCWGLRGYFEDPNHPGVEVPPTQIDAIKIAPTSSGVVAARGKFLAGTEGTVDLEIHKKAIGQIYFDSPYDKSKYSNELTVKSQSPEYQFTVSDYNHGKGALGAVSVTIEAHPGRASRG